MFKINVTIVRRTVIISLWIIMMLMLARKQLMAAKPLSILPQESVIPQGASFKENWMGIYYNEQKIGYSNTIIQDLSKVEDSLSGYSISHNTYLAIPVLGALRNINLNGNAFLDNQFRPLAFQFYITSGKYSINLTGKAKGEHILVRVSSSGEERFQEFEVDRDLLFFSIPDPSLFFASLKPKETRTIEVFDPLTLSSGVASIQFVGLDREYTKKASKDIYVIEILYQGLLAKSWIGSDGDILRQESPLGFLMMKEPQEKARTIPPYQLFEKDILKNVSIGSNIAIPRPRAIKFLKLDLYNIKPSEFDIEAERQRTVSLGPQRVTLSITSEGLSQIEGSTIKSQSNFEEFLKPEFLIQSDDPKIIQKAKEILDGEIDSLKASLKILDWVFRELKKRPSLGLPSALDVLRNREGDCNEHTYLYVALARASGIPAKIVTGLVYYNGRFYYHTWPKVFVGGWLNLDPLLGQSVADATHIQLLEGGIETQSRVIKLIRRLNLKVKEYR